MPRFPRFVANAMIAALAALFVAVPQLIGQSSNPTEVSARASDVSSIESIVTALYETISGPGGQERDWDRFRSLFVADARLIPTSPSRDGARFRTQMRSVDDYIESTAPFFLENGFFELESHSVIERFENIAHVFSTYESRRSPNSAVFQRGINSIQLAWDGERWWIVNILWRGVGPDFAIPAKYLTGH